MNSKKYEPLSLLFFEDKRKASIIHSVFDEKQFIFKERESEGWIGNGYDWAAVARVILEEKANHLIEEVGFDPHEDMVEIYGEANIIEEFAKILKKVYDDDALLRDLLSRAELDRSTTSCEEQRKKNETNLIFG